MKFTEKNDFLVKHTSEKHFSKDLELFKVHCPNSKLHTDLKRINSFNCKKLDGLMLWELLDKVSPEEILKNRDIEAIQEIIEIIDTIEGVKEILSVEFPNLEFPEESILKLVGKTKADFVNFADFGNFFIAGLNEELKNKEQELEEKEEELTNKESELEEKEESLDEKYQELEDKEKVLSEKKTEPEKTSPKKKINKKSSLK